MSDPQSYCPFCKRTHDAPEFIETLERLTELTTNDGIEIGSYRKGTGLRGELKDKDAELDAYEDEIERLEAELKEAYAEIRKINEREGFKDE